ncbi:alpha/beta hydrolase (plasmid) [Agrobacterium tumefaciens]|uniref:Alpha/beta hydrolase n=1 Tax=Agrobacterium tumefaciens TaxID=358 RepID=A0AAP9EAB2_AGRTU|nr:alpha/beta hydrolase [Agrobacterium tumefaciens]NSZ60105.1 alpha/beta hydrolase [Agrobacterium tumefaciens]QDY97702.2 alpha/beta hydrolase [Agrobacterium tumefaciens]UXS12825.1 alpha/beta hydrolase [Agrobacterium tumefaciens]UXS20187.1 alpha/beta hydrolase [Agrobacterium tumefaciens]UXS27834.1 alpha/beta hydrolase [Agrobacterium tumefaciens]
MADPNSPNGPNGIYVLPFADIEHIANKHLDMAYASTSEFQKLDLYLPEGEAPIGGWPLLVFVHGGAWMMCDKRDIQLNPPLRLLKEEIAVASINYRLSSEAKFPAQIHDVKTALRCLKARAREFGIAKDRVAIWGASAGAHLAALAGTSAGVSLLEDLSTGWAEEDARVRAVVSWFGPTNFLKMDLHLSQTRAGDPDHNDAQSPESKLLGIPITEARAMVHAANPETWITPDCPPFLFQHAPNDPIVPVQQSILFADLISRTAGPDRAILHLVENAGHAGPEFERDDVVDKSIDFLRDHLLAKA